MFLHCPNMSKSFKNCSDPNKSVCNPNENNSIKSTSYPCQLQIQQITLPSLTIRFALALPKYSLHEGHLEG